MRATRLDDGCVPAASDMTSADAVTPRRGDAAARWRGGAVMVTRLESGLVVEAQRAFDQFVDGDAVEASEG
ncbi:hypothetical protein GCM10009741_04440 [Kribbella lupini]|uniref:Uncharacterized protein n=1 Tax=Kribbella lupini TaxID=291602 RepID=A0ABN2A359_9ACTN